MTTTRHYPELEIRLFRVQPDATQVELYFDDSGPGESAERHPILRTAALDATELHASRDDPPSYGRKLAAQLFSDPEIRTGYAEALAAVADDGRLLRLRLVIDSSADELHSVHWELLRDPETDELLVTDSKILFFRFLFSRDWRPVRLRRRAKLEALIAVIAPDDLASYQALALQPVNLDAEIARARQSLSGIPATVAGRNEPLTLDRLIARLRPGVDVLYLVCHAIVRRRKPVLMLQDETGKVAQVEGSELARRLRELPRAPRLAVLAAPAPSSRGAAGDLSNASPQELLAPKLTGEGVPAVLALPGTISARTVAEALPVFFAELTENGQIERALALARQAVRNRQDAWMPALYTRLRHGRIWYDPGFGKGRADAVKWKALTTAIGKGRFTPVVGWGLGERIYGSPHDLAYRLAGDRFPLASHQRRDPPKVLQYLQVAQDSSYYALKSVKDQMREEVLHRHRGLLDPAMSEAALARLLREVSRIHRRDDSDPYRLLAQLPAPLYFNVSSDNLLEEALKAAGRPPDRLYPRWKTALEPPAYDKVPTVENPLIFHIFGHFADQDSLVLTEDDYFDFLIGASANRALMPKVVRHALADSSLLFLGFQLTDWSFRVLYRLILSQEGGSARRWRHSHAAVQVDPDGVELLDVVRARRYLTDYYYNGNVSLFWGSSEDFLVELQRQLATTPVEKVAA